MKNETLGCNWKKKKFYSCAKMKCTDILGSSVTSTDRQLANEAEPCVIVLGWNFCLCARLAYMFKHSRACPCGGSSVVIQHCVVLWMEIISMNADSITKLTHVPTVCICGCVDGILGGTWPGRHSNRMDSLTLIGDHFQNTRTSMEAKLILMCTSLNLQTLPKGASLGMQSW